MARYKNGINGTFKGKLGNVVGASSRGIDYMRSLPTPTLKAPSEKQLNQRALLSMVSSWLKPLKALIWIGYQIFNGEKTPMNQAVAFHLKEAVTGNSAATYAIDFARAVFSRGELLISLIKQVLALADGILSIEWENPSASVFCKDDDRATVVVYNPAKQEFVTFQDIALRAEQKVDLQLPENFSGDVVHTWMHYVNAAGDAVSTTQYLGEIQIFYQIDL
ncbi:DUF6266 family protein [Pedobacter africanus]|uniref:Uncharacterized protein n=1 Tax=Pedobacter africanus TaxID=151894 RepID=A0A1W2AEP4_9SPHI|nr:DUF6266 family protein [Pedobacter africanus]SMC59199.1 hypothetical protein SAMN04488524_1356 [Pedobacter africanus]